MAEIQTNYPATTLGILGSEGIQERLVESLENRRFEDLPQSFLLEGLFQQMTQLEQAPLADTVPGDASDWLNSDP